MQPTRAPTGDKISEAAPRQPNTELGEFALQSQQLQDRPGRLRIDFSDVPVDCVLALGGDRNLVAFCFVMRPWRRMGITEARCEKRVRSCPRAHLGI